MKIAFTTSMATKAGSPLAIAALAALGAGAAIYQRVGSASAVVVSPDGKGADRHGFEPKIVFDRPPSPFLARNRAAASLDAAVVERPPSVIAAPSLRVAVAPKRVRFQVDPVVPRLRPAAMVEAVKPAQPPLAAAAIPQAKADLASAGESKPVVGSLVQDKTTAPAAQAATDPLAIGVGASENSLAAAGNASPFPEMQVGIEASAVARAGQIISDPEQLSAVTSATAVPDAPGLVVAGTGTSLGELPERLQPSAVKPEGDVESYRVLREKIGRLRTRAERAAREADTGLSTAATAPSKQGGVLETAAAENGSSTDESGWVKAPRGRDAAASVIATPGDGQTRRDDYRVDAAGKISVRVGYLLDQVASHMDLQTLVHLRAARAAGEFVSFDDLRKAGFSVDFDLARGEIILASVN